MDTISTQLSSSQIKELLGSDLSSDYTLNSVYEVENVLLILQNIAEKIDWLKKLKKYRTQSIDERILSLDERTDALRNVILQTMKRLDPNQKTLVFPSIGTVTRKKTPSKWKVDSEEEVLKFLDESGHKSDVIKVKESIDLNSLKKVLDSFSSAKVEVPGVTLVDGSESISIKYDKMNEENNADKTDTNLENAKTEVKKVMDILDGIDAEDL